MNANEAPPEFPASCLVIPTEEELKYYTNLKTEEIDNKVRIRPEKYYIFSTLFKNAKLNLYNMHKFGSIKSELIMIVDGNKLLYDILARYDIISTINLYRKLIKFFNINALARIPELNLSTVFDKQRDKSIFIRMTGNVHGLICDWAELFSTSEGNIALLDIMLYFETLCEGTIYDHQIMEYIRISNRLESSIKGYSILSKNHLISMTDDLKRDIRYYGYGLEKGEGEAWVMDRKQKLFESVLTLTGQSK